MVTDRLFRRLRKLIQTEDTLAKAADKAGVPGLQYDADADRQSWSEMIKLFKGIWA